MSVNVGHDVLVAVAEGKETGEHEGDAVWVGALVGYAVSVAVASGAVGWRTVDVGRGAWVSETTFDGVAWAGAWRRRQARVNSSIRRKPSARQAKRVSLWLPRGDPLPWLLALGVVIRWLRARALLPGQVEDYRTGHRDV